MGYFSNGTDGIEYGEQYCQFCVHDNEEKGCPVMMAHFVYNYDECNNDKSILHILIPRKGIENEVCLMFYRGNPVEEPEINQTKLDKWVEWATQ